MTAPKHVLVLRTCDRDLKSYGGFQWPASGPVSCPDWNPAAICGYGLHGALWGEGNGELLALDDPDAKWLVVKVKAADVVELGGKVKFPAGEVVHCGDRTSATEYLVARAPGRAVIGASLTAGTRGTATAGYAGTATAGDAGTATAGTRGTATAGTRGTATAGYAGTATAGTRGTATAGYAGTATAGTRGTATAGTRGTATAGYAGTATAGTRGTATAGYAGTATAGYAGTATAGTRGTATAGYAGTATAGYAGTATAGTRGTATAGYAGIVELRWWDGARYRITIGYIGENGLQAGVAYKCDASGNIVPAAKA
jgi:hypothetical protein